MSVNWVAHGGRSTANGWLTDWASRVVLTTGPLATDPTIQRFVGVLVENGGRGPVDVREWLYNLETCPKSLAFEDTVTIHRNCAVGIAYPNPGGFYEVRLSLPRHHEDIRVTIYGLGPAFETLAANTLHGEDLVRV